MIIVAYYNAYNKYLFHGNKISRDEWGYYNST